MNAPAWLKNATQPIAIDDALRYLVQAPSIMASTGREIQIGGPDVLSYGEMLDRSTVVTDPSGAELFDDVHPVGSDEALRRAVADASEPFDKGGSRIGSAATVAAAGCDRRGPCESPRAL